MKTEHPILFSTEMVQAILAGRKTMTRRVVKPQAISYTGDMLSQAQIYACDKNGDADPTPIRCPYGITRDRLWVRETWKNAIQGCGYRYRADGELKNLGKWKPSIFMPRHASRINLEVGKIRVRRLQEITEEDAKREGVQVAVDKDKHLLLDFSSKHIPTDYFSLHVIKSTRLFTSHFAALWDTINAKRGYSWKSNPWVWVIEFKMVKP